MSIHLGLGRVKRLLSLLGNPHSASYKSVHIGGTNGKGSTVAYLTLILTQAKIRNGRFTSPHLVSYNDCVAIDNQAYPLEKFDHFRALVLDKDTRHHVGCTEFELLTATALHIFAVEKVELAVIEVGLGGRLDATNVLGPWPGHLLEGGVIACGITKIGMDHEALLGGSLAAIAREKAGIIKRGVPVVVDPTNDESVLEELMRKAMEEGLALIFADEFLDRAENLVQYSPLLGAYQSLNLLVALKVVEEVKKKLPHLDISRLAVVAGIKNTVWPGRLQRVTESETGVCFLLDGAHNESAAVELAKYLAGVRENGFIFVVAMTDGKLVSGLLKHIADETADAIIPFHFTGPDHMPWVKCQTPAQIAEAAKPYLKEVLGLDLPDVSSLFRYLEERRKAGDNRLVVICGSLYLCSDILRHCQATGLT